MSERERDADFETVRTEMITPRMALARSETARPRWRDAFAPHAYHWPRRHLNGLRWELAMPLVE